MDDTKESINQSMGQSDKDMVRSFSKALTMRRKQLCVLDLNEIEMMRLVMPGYVYETNVRLDAKDPENSAWLHTANHFNVSLTKIFPKMDTQCMVQVSARKDLVCMRQGHGVMYPQRDAPAYLEFVRWLREAVKVELENHITRTVINHVLDNTTTYKQLFKALPESMQAVSAVAGANDSYVYRPQCEKIVKGLRIMNSEGANRARNLHPDTMTVLERHKSVVESTLAQAVMLDDHDGMQKGHLFDNTWVENVTDGFRLSL